MYVSHVTIEAAKNIRKEIKTQGLSRLKNTWEQKSLHGRYAQRIRNAIIEIVKANRWLKSAGLKVETEGLIIAA